MEVKKGDIILEAEPFAYALYQECQGVFCDNCIDKSKKLMKCGGCQFVKYCSKNCQKNGWKMHRRECHFIRENKPEFVTLYFARIILRLQDRSAKPDTTKGLVSETKVRNFWDLTSHAEEIRKDINSVKNAAVQYNRLKIFFGEKFQTTLEEVFQIFCRVQSNSHGINTLFMTRTLGMSLYLIPSGFEHSCRSNTVYKYSGTKLICISNIDWPKFDSSKIRVSYVDNPATRTTAERRKILKERYYFWCECELCNDVERDRNMSSIRCGNENCDAAVYVDMDLPKEAPIGKCPKCSFNSFNSNTRRKYYIIINLIETAKQQNDHGSLRKVIKNPGNILHDLNIYMVTARMEISKSCEMNLQDIKQMEKALVYYYKGFMTPYEVLEPNEVCRLIGVFDSLKESNISE